MKNELRLLCFAALFLVLVAATCQNQAIAAETVPARVGYLLQCAPPVVRQIRTQGRNRLLHVDNRPSFASGPRTFALA